MFGAKGDGVTDDTNAIQKAVNDSTNHVYFNTDKTYLITKAIILKSELLLDFNGCNIVANTNGDLFVLDKANGEARQLTIKGSNCGISGKCANVFHFIGNNNFNISPSNYARLITLDSIRVSGGDTINCFVKMDVAVRDVWITNCSMWCSNGVVSTGKSVEILLDNNIMYTSNSSGFSLQISSNQNSHFYSEGWTIDNCTIDNGAVEISDIYVIFFTNCYIGSNVTFSSPTTTTHTRDIMINNCVFRRKLTFNSSLTGETSFYAMINNCTINGILRLDHAAHINVSNVNFQTNVSPDEYLVAILGSRNLKNIVIKDIRCDNTYNNTFIINNPGGINNIILDTINFYGQGSAISLPNATKPYVLCRNICGGADFPEKNLIFGPISNGTYDVGEIMFQKSFSCPKGQRGEIRIHFRCTNDSSTQRLDFTFPTNMKVPTGTGWSSSYLYTEGNHNIEYTIPYYCTDAVSGDIILKNGNGNSITVGYHGWYSITLE